MCAKKRTTFWQEVDVENATVFGTVGFPGTHDEIERWNQLLI